MCFTCLKKIKFVSQDDRVESGTVISLFPFCITKINLGYPNEKWGYWVKLANGRKFIDFDVKGKINLWITDIGENY